MKKNVEKEILRKIKKGEVKMRPKWWFIAMNRSAQGALVMAVLTAGAGIMAVGTFVDVYRPWDILQLGEVGRQLLLEDFPYWWLATGLLFFGLGIWLLEKIGDNYKRTTKIRTLAILVIGLILVTLFGFGGR